MPFPHLRLPPNFLLPRNSSNYKVGGTNTFRIASSKLFGRDGYGTNMQNWEKMLRSIHHADSGYKLIQVDQAGAEALIVAYLCRDGNYRELFRSGIKPHTYTALVIFEEVWAAEFGSREKIREAIVTPIKDVKNLPYWKELDAMIRSSDDWPGGRRYYFIGKKLRHASSYGMGPGRYSSSVLEETNGLIKIPIQVAKVHMDKDAALFPEIRMWQFRVIEEIKKSEHTLRNLYGYPRKFTGFIGEGMYKEAFAFIPQSTVGCITNIAITKLQDYIQRGGKDWHILTNTHDSYLCEVPEAEIQSAISVMKEFIQPSFVSPVDGIAFTMRSDASVGTNWGPYKKDKNEEGMKSI